MLAGLYSLTTHLVEPAAPLLLRVRLWRGKEDGARMAEKLGRDTGTRPEGRLVWIHAASVGESLSALPLIERLARTGGTAILVTTGTTTSAAIMADRLPEGAFHRYAPVDGPRAVRRFLDRWRPDAALWVESELWPNLLGETRRRGIPTALVNGRMSPRSFARWRRVPSMAHSLIAGFDILLAQSEADAARLSALGARQVTTAGDLKAAAPPLEADPENLARIRAAIGGRPAWVAASTHSGDEAMAAEVHADVKTHHRDLLTVIVPRHANRAEAIANDLAARGLAVVRRSTGALPDATTDVFLGDSMGEMGLYLRLGNPVFMGKSMLHIGGHNPREPALLGRAVLFGPHMENVIQAAEALLQAGGALEVADRTALAAAISRLLDQPQSLESMGARAQQRVEADAAGILDAALAALAPMLERRA